jgi:1-deoxy-D-xylulose 5-phosphate reductoisomerase
MLALVGADEVAVSRFLVAQGTFGDIVAVLRTALAETGDQPLEANVRAHVEAVAQGRQLAQRWFDNTYGMQPDDRKGA